MWSLVSSEYTLTPNVRGRAELQLQLCGLSQQQKHRNMFQMKLECRSWAGWSTCVTWPFLNCPTVLMVDCTFMWTTVDAEVLCTPPEVCSSRPSSCVCTLLLLLETIFFHRKAVDFFVFSLPEKTRRCRWAPHLIATSHYFELAISYWDWWTDYGTCLELREASLWNLISPFFFMIIPDFCFCIFFFFCLSLSWRLLCFSSLQGCDTGSVNTCF